MCVYVCTYVLYLVLGHETREFFNQTTFVPAGGPFLALHHVYICFFLPCQAGPVGTFHLVSADYNEGGWG